MNNNIFPKISIITPCFNMEAYIEKTILSILNQNYPNLEYIIVDGGSTDGTLDIVNKYKDRISLIISEKDNGMYDAIHKGFRHATGEIFAWLNADDQYFPWTLQIVARIFNEHLDVEWLCGLYAFLDESGSLTRVYNNAGAKRSKDISNGWYRKEIYGYLLQESMFWRKELYFKSGSLNLNYKYAGDFELWMRFAKETDLLTVSLPLSGFMRRKSSLSMNDCDKYETEVTKAIQNKKKLPNLLWKLMPKNQIFVCFMRLLTWKKSKMYFYSFAKQKFLVKSVLRSVSSNSFVDLYYEYLYNKYSGSDGDACPQ